MAAVRCLPDTSNEPNYFGGIFDKLSLQEIACGTSLGDLENASFQDLSTLEVLTSQPDLLNETEVQMAAQILTSLQKQDNTKVWKI